MADRNTLKTKLIAEYKQVCWAIGYWQRRLELSDSLDKEQYCAEGIDRNEKLKPGLELALRIAGVKISTPDWYEPMAEGVKHANQTQAVHGLHQARSY